MTDEASYILEVADLNFALSGRAILRDLSFALKPGQHQLILAPSGTGKTSLINLITGLATPNSGVVRVAGQPMSHLSPVHRDAVRRQHIGVVFQSLRLVSALSVMGNLALAQSLSGQPKDKAAITQLIDSVGLSHRSHAKPRALSQGEAQRAAIARALITRPALLVADEPTSALDDANADKIARLLLNRAEDYNATLLIATHDARLKKHIPNVLHLPKLTEDSDLAGVLA